MSAGHLVCTSHWPLGGQWCRDMAISVSKTGCRRETIFLTVPPVKKCFDTKMAFKYDKMAGAGADDNGRYFSYISQERPNTEPQAVPEALETLIR